MPSSNSIRSSDSGDGPIKFSDERTPLLASLTPIPTNTEPQEANSRYADVDNAGLDDEDAPLPSAQIFFLCYTRLVEPIAFFAIFPYINQMIEQVGGIDVKDVGFYSGMIESLFSLVQMVFMIPWGKASDRFGRRPCLIVSLFGITASTALFGMATSIPQMILFRCLAGAFSGTLVTVRTMLTENSTKKTQARAFSYFAFAGNLGIFAGPLLGGAFESPAKNFPSVFGQFQFFRDYPYALPGFICASVGLTAAILTTVFVRETLHLHNRPSDPNQARLSTWELIKSPGVAKVIFIYNYVLVLAFAYTAANPVFLHTPVNLGGIGFSPKLIAAAIGLNGVSQAIWLLVPFPWLHKRIGTVGVFRLCAVSWPVFLAVHPISNLLLRHGLKAAFWTIAPLGIVLGSGVAMAFTAQQLAINDIAPTHETLGTLNAIVLTVSSGIRAVAPATFTSLFATGVKYQILDGQFFWVIIITIAVGLIGVVRLLPEKAAGRPQKQDEAEEETIIR